MLSYYQVTFHTVEINNTFYQLPTSKTLIDWGRRTTAGFLAGFLFSCKGRRFITHMKKLKDPEKSVARFFEVVEVLGNKLGSILFQPPPKWRANSQRLDDFLKALPNHHRSAFESRDESWFNGEVYDVLPNDGAAFCIYELGGRRSPIEITADFVYIRLHGPGDAYQGDYDGRTLFGWVRRLVGWRDDGKDVFCYFDNDERAYSAFNAEALQEMIERA